MRIDAWKLCHLCRRPEPRSCEDIGTWMSILEVLSYAAVFVNSGIVAFTQTGENNQTWVSRIWIFILMSSGLVFIKYLISELIPDVTNEVEIQLERQKYYIGKVLYNLPDENNDDLTKITKTNIKFQIRINDDDPL
jgi:hypothetical protein